MPQKKTEENTGAPYSIKQVSDMLGIPASTIRYYDKEGLLPFVQRKASGYRSFSESDVSLLRLIECLKQTGMPIKDIGQFAEWARQGDASLAQRLEMFHERRAAVANQQQQLQQTMDLIQYKCWYYETAVQAGTEAIHHNSDAHKCRAKASGAGIAPKPETHRESRLLDLMRQPETAVVFDIDGVLAVYEFGDVCHAAAPDGSWEEYVVSNNPYASIPPAPALQRFIAQRDPSRLFACSVAEPYEEEGKRNFVLRNYAIAPKNIRMVASKDEKVAFLEHVAESLGISRTQVVLVEDTVKTLDAAQAQGFTTCHVSTFFLL